jgi:hypothetical protein
MMRYEYQTYFIQFPEEIEEVLNSMGDQGYRLQNTVSYEEGTLLIFVKEDRSEVLKVLPKAEKDKEDMDIESMLRNLRKGTLIQHIKTSNEDN